jgi:glycosyltransferase involved in cell wall biosynthesis
MTPRPRVSLIVTTYNWPEALRITLHSVTRQSSFDGEIIIGDDGSGSETAKTIEDVLRPSAIRWCHVRQDDISIRQARVKNLAVKYSRYEYLIFIDHDVVLHPDFISDHLRMSEKGVFLQGKRCFLGQSQTRRMLDHGFFLPSFLSPHLKNRKNAIRNLLLGRALSRKKRFQRTLRGCNLSMHKEDFLRVDGYDEVFDQLWGREDSDICYRLFHNNVRIKNLWFRGIQYHLHHQVTKGREKDRLDYELERVLEEKRNKAIRGFSHLSSEGSIVSASDSFWSY